MSQNDEVHSENENDQDTKAPTQVRYVNIKKIRDQSEDSYKARAEFNDGSIMDFVLRKAIPYNVQRQMYKEKIMQMKTNDEGDQEVEVDMGRWIDKSWEYLVKKVKPKIDLVDLGTLPQEFSNEIIGFVFEQWQNNKADIPELKKNSKPS